MNLLPVLLAVTNFWPGPVEMHLVDDDAGQTNSNRLYHLKAVTVKELRGTTLHFSAQIRQERASNHDGVGLSLSAAGEKGPPRRASIHTGELGAFDYRPFHCALKVPDDARSIVVSINAAVGWGQTCEAYFKDFLLTTHAADHPRMPVRPLEELDEVVYRYHNPSNDTPEIAEYRRSYREQPPKEKDERDRPEIKHGTFYFRGRPHFFVGPWVQNHTRIDWDLLKKPHLGIMHPAYLKPFGKEVFEELGMNSCQISAAHSQYGALLRGFPVEEKMQNYPFYTWRQREQEVETYYKRMDDLPLVLDFAFGYASAYPEEARRLIDQKKRGAWHHFVPFCPHVPEGLAYYRDYFLGGTRAAMRYGANVYMYELFNESAWNCMCRPAIIRFAAEMKERYGTIEKANERWDTVFLDFDELAVQSSMKQYPGVWRDWCVYSSREYVKLLRFGKDTVRSVDRRDRVYFCEQAAGHPPYRRGMDYRDIAAELDVLSLEGGWRFGDNRTVYTSKSEMEDVVAMKGSKHFFNCDFFRALVKDRKPFVNNEHYCTRYQDGLRVPSKATDYITALWLETMHGCSANYTYSWDKRSWESNTPEKAYENVKNPSYKSSSLLNPYNVKPEDLDAFGRFLRELEPYRDRLLPCPRTAPATVAIFYSKPTEIFYDVFPRFSEKESKAHPPTVTRTQNWYERLLHATYPVRIVFEEDLDTLGAEVKALVFPEARCALASTIKAAELFGQRGGLVIASEDSFMYDEYLKPTPGNTHLFTRVKTATGALAELEKRAVPRYVTVEPIDGGERPVGLDAQLCDRGDFKLLVIAAMGEENPRKVRVTLSNLKGAGPFQLKNAITGAELDCADPSAGFKLVLPPQERVVIELVHECMSALVPLSMQTKKAVLLVDKSKAHNGLLP